MLPHTEICDAIQNRDLEYFQAALHASNVHINERCECGKTPLEVAVDSRDIRFVKALLDAGASVESDDATDAWSTRNKGALDSAMVEAKRESNLEPILLLLNGGLNVDFRDWAGWTLLARAAWGSSQLVEELLKRGADPNSPSSAGMTPLMAAAMLDIANCTEHESFHIIDLLFRYGAKGDLRNIYGETAVDILDKQSWLDGSPMKTRIRLRMSNY